ncbi:Vacuolar protein sorting-associated protein 62 [Puccinia graminis f. sp. tritici]|uniref:Vacuolar protein sorting-associated protein 62 n=1 Tax=Puccinia graminis f. sp. tritici TaxID=56615 RepID=A0A5B0RAY3_PUCGR|nr:Vacuolar protein sorting-associated protein 62 [Puccinia graminis f. sp. tritici]
MNKIKQLSLRRSGRKSTMTAPHSLPESRVVNPATSQPAILTTTNTFRGENGGGVGGPGSRTLSGEEGTDPFVRNSLGSVPAYVLEYAPMVHLNSNEPFWPASLEEHLRHTILHDHAPDGPATRPADHHHPCSILALPQFNHERCYLTANTDVKPAPTDHPWLVSLEGKPGPDAKSQVSPVILILVDKSIITGVPGTLDAFWFFFYSFNLGPTVANIHFGNHIADWEHCMIRFENGTPKAAHLSAHADGSAYTYDCLEKFQGGKRPVIFSALGSHAMYTKPGTHDYSPVKFVGPTDHTDRGPLWDPTLNFAAFQHYPSPARDKFRAIDEDKDGKLVPCLKFRGQWGDQFSSPPINPQKAGGWMANMNMFQPMKRTMSLHNLRWGDGVTGPRDKDLDRAGMNRYSHRIHTSI